MAIYKHLKLSILLILITNKLPIMFLYFISTSFVKNKKMLKMYFFHPRDHGYLIVIGVCKDRADWALAPPEPFFFKWLVIGT